MTDSSPLRVAIVGAGPSGFYAAGQLLAVGEPQFAVDLYDRLPTPYGLVRSGVAPDHPKIKSVTRAYDKTTEHERFRFFGHVELGADIGREHLLEHYHVVLLHDRHVDRQAAGDPGRGPPRLACRDRVRRLVQRPSRPLGPRGRPAGQAGGGRRGGQRRDRRRADARAGPVRARDHRHGRPRDRGAERQRDRGDHDPRPPRPAPGRVHEPRAARDGRARARRRRGRRRRARRAVGGRAPGRRQDPPAQRRDHPGLRRAAEDRQADHRPLPLPRLAGRAARRRRRPRPRREDREQRDRRARRRLAGRARHRNVRGDPGPARVPLDRLHRGAGRRDPVRRASRPDPQRGRARHRRRRRSPARRVRVGLDQARPVRRDRNEQEGFAGHRRQDPRGRGRRPPQRPRRRRHRGDDRDALRARGHVGGLAGDQRDRDRRRRGVRPGRPRVKLTEWAALREAAKGAPTGQARR